MNEKIELLIRKGALLEVEIAVASGIPSLSDWLKEQYSEINQRLEKLATENK